MRNACNTLVGKPEGKGSLGSCRGKWEIGFKMDLKKNRVSECNVDSCSSGYRPVAGCFEDCNEPSASIKGGEFLDKLRDYRLLKKGFTLQGSLVHYFTQLISSWPFQTAFDTSPRYITDTVRRFNQVQSRGKRISYTFMELLQTRLYLKVSFQNLQLPVPVKKKGKIYPLA
jgi:hypothetical protein